MIASQNLLKQVNAAPESAAVFDHTLHKVYQPKVAYMMSRFPKITETFILYEMLAVEGKGVEVEVYPLVRERTELMHPEAKQYLERAHFQSYLSWSLVRSHLYFLRHKPRVYLGTLGTLLRANWSSPRFFTRAIGLFPKAVHYARLMAADGVTHIHAHFASHPAAAAFVIHRLVNIPYSFTAHGSDLHRDRHMLPEKVSEAAFVVPISNYNRELIIDDCGERFRDKVIVIHCGVDTQRFQPRSDPTPYERGEGPFTILCIGTLHEVKGQTYLIQACQLLQEQGVNFLCHFLGDGPDLESLQSQVDQAGLSSRVRFHGRLTQGGIADLLQRADVVATPSVPTSSGRREGIPVVLMEAMSSGVPVVASALSGIPELVIDGQTGLLVCPRDVPKLAAAVRRLYSDPILRRRLGQAGRKKVVEEFDLLRNSSTLARYFGLEMQS